MLLLGCIVKATVASTSPASVLYAYTISAGMRLSTGLLGAGAGGSRSAICIHLQNLGCGDASIDSTTFAYRGSQETHSVLESMALSGQFRHGTRQSVKVMSKVSQAGRPLPGGNVDFECDTFWGSGAFDVNVHGSVCRPLVTTCLPTHCKRKVL